MAQQMTMQPELSHRPKIACRDCRHRSGVGFRDLAPSELEFMTAFKTGHDVAWAGETLIRQGEPSDLLGVLYSGLAVKYCVSEEHPQRPRQVLAVLMPGDLIGLDNAYGKTPSHSVATLTDTTFCRFDPKLWGQLLAIPELVQRLGELQLMDQRHMEARFASVASFSARRSIAFFIVQIYDRMFQRRSVREDGFSLPLTIRQFADALGLTTVHLHRVLRALREEGVFTYDRRRVTIHDIDRLREIACVPQPSGELRPLI